MSQKPHGLAKVCTEAVDIITKNVPLLDFPSDRIINLTLEIAYKLSRYQNE